MPIILVTGAAGGVGSMLRTRLARPGRTLRLLDIAPLTAGPGEEAITASVTDLDAMTEACRNVTAVVHLAGIPGEAPWEQIREVNIDGTYSVFEAARRAGVGRVV
jgi:uronate dehydrogenase